MITIKSPWPRLATTSFDDALPYLCTAEIVFQRMYEMCKVDESTSTANGVWSLAPLLTAIMGVMLTALWEQKRLGNYHFVNLAIYLPLQLQRVAFDVIAILRLVTSSLRCTTNSESSVSHLNCFFIAASLEHYPLLDQLCTGRLSAIPK